MVVFYLGGPRGSFNVSDPYQVVEGCSLCLPSLCLQPCSLCAIVLFLPRKSQTISQSTGSEGRLVPNNYLFVDVPDVTPLAPSGNVRVEFQTWLKLRIKT